MSKKIETLTVEQLHNAKLIDKQLRSLINIRNELSSFKLNDVYIKESWDPRATTPVKYVYKTHMDFPIKYKVVYISPEGIPYLRKLNPNGNPTGEALMPPQAQSLEAYFNALKLQTSLGGSLEENWAFVPDPEQLDAILLQSDFNPTEDHKTKLKLFNEINKHNKRVTVKSNYSNDYSKILEFFKTRQPGDKFWTSPDNVFVIQSVSKVGREWLITATDKNQQTKEFNCQHFLWRRLYKEQPRSFKRESAD